MSIGWLDLARPRIAGSLGTGLEERRVKVIRVWPKSEIHPLDTPGLDGDAAHQGAISAVTQYALELLRGLPEVSWRVVYVEDRDKVGPAKGAVISQRDLLEVIRNSIDGICWAVLRDDSCRSLRAGYDYYLHFVLASEDAVPDGSGFRVNVQDVSQNLVETDFYDL